ncbi:DUF5615 family PIN-like protein [Candidatus Daviesbacteria bacterium]|nr:DUF5615 family PIN-like protein [Candidatus Daviesbacteria bacterium]
MIIILIKLHNKPSHKKKKRFRLLLDSAFAKCETFPRLKNKANIAHVVHEYGLSPQTEDEEIYQKAVNENRFVLTINFKDFRRLVMPGKPGIIGIESQLSNDDIDKLVANFLSNKNPEDYMGKATKI